MYNYHSYSNHNHHNNQNNNQNQNQINERNKLEASNSLGVLSQITIEKEDFDHFDFLDTTEDLKHRLEELEEITVSFLAERPLPLTSLIDSFADIDEKSSQEFEFYIPEFTRNDVLCLDVACLSSTLNNSIGVRSARNNIQKIHHEPLEVSLRRVNDEAQTFLPSYHNGEYEFVLTSAHGMTSGRFILHIQNIGVTTQSVRAHLSVLPYVVATPLTAGESIIRKNLSRNGEFTYFRFLLQDPSHLVSIRVNSIRNDNNEESDPDIYVSNKYSGLVQVNQENYIWRSAMIGSDQVDIHPNFDIRAKRGNTFLIGVVGQKDQFQDFSICVTAIPPPTIVPCLLNEIYRDITIYSDKYSYFSIPVDSEIEGKILLSIQPLPTSHDSLIQTNHNSEFDSESLNNQFGRGLYTLDTLVSSGIFHEDRRLVESNKSSMKIIDTISRQIKGDDNYNSKNSNYSLLSLSIPPSISKTEGLFPVAHFSDHCLYPSADFFTWRGTSLKGDINAIIERSEWKYSETNTCYMSLIGISLPNCEKISNSLKCRISLQSISDVDVLNEEWKRKHEIYQSIFNDVDGCAISQKERSKRSQLDEYSSDRIDAQGLTYGEVDLSSFVEILLAAGARDNQIFVDLGCGVGKTLVAAALSGIKFMRCIGIELLPGLCVEANKVLQEMKQVLDLPNNSDLRLLQPLMEIWEGDVGDNSLRRWTDADIIYMSSLCFPDYLLQKIMLISRNMRPGSTIITLKLPENYQNYFDLISRSWHKMTWGRVLVYFLRRNNNYTESSSAI